MADRQGMTCRGTSRQAIQKEKNDRQDDRTIYGHDYIDTYERIKRKLKSELAGNV